MSYINGCIPTLSLWDEEEEKEEGGRGLTVGAEEGLEDKRASHLELMGATCGVCVWVCVVYVCVNVCDWEGV